MAQELHEFYYHVHHSDEAHNEGYTQRKPTNGKQKVQKCKMHEVPPMYHFFPKYFGHTPWDPLTTLGVGTAEKKLAEEG